MPTYTDDAVRQYIAENYANLSGDPYYTAIATKANEQGVSAEQLARVLGFSPDVVSQYASNVGMPLVSAPPVVQTTPATYTDDAIKQYIAENYSNLSGDSLYTTLAKEAKEKGVSAEQMARVLGFTPTEVSQYATNVGFPLTTTTPTTQAKSIAPTTPTPSSFNPATLVATPTKFRELFPSFAESQRLATQAIQGRPTLDAVIAMVQNQGKPAAANP